MVHLTKDYIAKSTIFYETYCRYANLKLSENEYNPNSNASKVACKKQTHIFILSIIHLRYLQLRYFAISFKEIIGLGLEKHSDYLTEPELIL